MKALILAAAAFVLAAPAIAKPVYVHGYTTKNGTYVAPHYRSSPDSSRLNNWSTQGNVNPYTGKVGTQNPYSTPSYTYPSYSPPAMPSYSYPSYPAYSPPAMPSYGSQPADSSDEDSDCC